MNDGVEIGKLGSVVAIVADSEENNAEMEPGDSTSLSLGRGYSPIIGGSLVFMP